MGLSCPGHSSRELVETRHLAKHAANTGSFNTTEIKVEDDLIPPGAKPGTIPTDYIQATGLERLELIGKMQGIDIFDMRPLDASRKGMSAFCPVARCSTLRRLWSVRSFWGRG